MLSIRGKLYPSKIKKDKKLTNDNYYEIKI
jgi:hypothetical protein